LSSGRSALASQLPDVLLLDLFLPDGNGLELFEAFESGRPRRYHREFAAGIAARTACRG
jgi:response regulator of citrate/malate metabolism